MHNTTVKIVLTILQCLTLILLTWRIWWDPNNASEWQMGFISAFKGLMQSLSDCRVLDAIKGN